MLKKPQKFNTTVLRLSTAKNNQKKPARKVEILVRHNRGGCTAY
jgi:hypothetical protein